MVLPIYTMIKYGVPYWIIYIRFATLVFVFFLYLGLSITTSFGWMSGGEWESGDRGKFSVRDGGGRISTRLQQDI